MLPLFLPRRSRRSLLFPPGLLALAGLLWLGCVALPRIQPPKVWALWVPSSPTYQNTCFSYNTTQCNTDNSFESAFYKLQPNPRRIFLSASGEWMDYFVSRKLDFVLPDNGNGDVADLQGIELYFSPLSSHQEVKQVVQLLQRRPNILFTVNTLRQLPTVLVYRQPVVTGIECVGIEALISSTDDLPSSSSHSTTIFSLPLFPEWRNTWLLLLLLSLLSGWRVARQWRPAAA
ncbi:hypothetical protein K3G63_08660 [Hymenobacter sp. HSC-4F20]|uniref:hypothetical protein n=1 Tax=Hymenobacter sp. HSC-4F20 TaxID=2864135 RepID=UPI001C735793|nr:hypothetical protein [Hymenobacter sp. HSC-4F20]MBX0290506.1 hypothetical protein [Hymenobacter sp. HSC-4F20]